MNVSAHIDPSELAPEAWARLLFGRTCDSDPTFIDALEYWDANRLLITNETRQLELLTLFLSDFVTHVASRFPAASVSLGVGGLLSAEAPGFAEPLMSHDVPLETKREFVGAMPAVFSDYVSTLGDSDIWYMWWHKVVYSIRDFHADSSAWATTELAQDCTSALSEVLKIDAVLPQECALHGLSHMRSPKSIEHIQAYIDSNRWKGHLSEEWLSECLHGRIA